MTAAQQQAALVPHPGVDPSSVADALLRVATLGAITIVQVAPAELGSCLACPPLSPVPPNPAVAVLCHREVDDDTSWVHRWPVCEQHLVVEVRPVLAKRVPVWVEAPSVVIDS